MLTEIINTQQLNSTQQIINTTVDFITNLILQCARKGTYIDNSKESAKALIKHLKSGKNIDNIIVDKADADIMRQCLEYYHVPFISVYKLYDGKEQEIIIIRDKDKTTAEKAVERFNMLKGIGIEMPADKFAEYNLGKDISTIQGLDEITLELFKRHAKEEKLTFSVQQNETEKCKWDIYVMQKDKDACDKLLKKAVWELSGDNGKKLAFDIESYIRNRDDFDAKLRPNKGETLYVVDNKNPTNFISVTRDGYSTHSITLDNNGNLTDVHSPIKPAYNRCNLLDLVSSLHKPVILFSDEYKLVTGIDAKGKANTISKNEFENELSILRNNLQMREDYFHNNFDVHDEIKREDIIIVRNLSEEQCKEIYTSISDKSNVCVIDGELAYLSHNKETVEPVLDKILYKDMDGLQKKELQLYHEGRGNISLASPISDNQYLLDADNPKVNITITPTGFALIENGKVVLENERLSDPDYDAHLLQAIDTLTMPVALSESEMKLPSEQKMAIIISRIPSKQESVTADYLQKNPERQMDTIINLSYIDNYHADFPLSDREQEAVDKLKQYKYVDVYVDRTIVEKITDLTVEKKVKSERVYSPEGIDRTVYDR